VDNGFGLADQPYKADVPYDIEQAAIFGEASLDVTDRLTLTAGARYFEHQENRRFHSGGLFSNGDDDTDSTESSGWTPRVIVSYDLTEDAKLNLQAAQGFRVGGVNDPLNIPICTPADAIVFGAFPKKYEDETAWNYEANFKTAGSGFTMGAAVFYNDISDLQVSFDAGSCSSRLVANVPEAHAAGVELEAGWNLTDQLQVTVAGSWNDAEFDTTVAAIPGVVEGNRIASVPEYQFAATANYSYPISMFGGEAEGFFAISAQHIGSRFTQPGDQAPGAGNFDHNMNPFGGMTGAEVTSLNLELDPYTIVNLNAGFESGNWTLIFYVNNALDENAQLAFDRERGGRARLGFHTNQPRTFGITARQSF
jgi:outer membrane receptor protein involved in Fe transport